MFRIDHATAAAALPAMTPEGTPGYFTDGDAGLGVPASVVQAEFLNRIQEEISNAITGAGIALDKANNSQLLAAINALIAAGIGGISAKQKRLVVETAVFETGVADGHPVRWNAATSKWDRAYADGTVNNLANGIADVTNSEVTIYGETPAGLVTGLTAGSRYYLTAAGGLSTVCAADVVKTGIAKSATVLWVDIDPQVGANKLIRIYDPADVNIASCVAGGTLIGSTQSVLLPTAGRLDLIVDQISLQVLSGTGFSFGFGIEIAGAPYWAISNGGDGDVYAPGSYTNMPIVIRGGWSHINQSFTGAGTAKVSFDIARLGCPTGVQNVGFRAGHTGLSTDTYWNNPVVVKGASTPTIAFIEVSPLN